MTEGKLELDLMRLLHGELPEERARELEARMERDPALARQYRRLRGSWEGLALPPAAAAPPGFVQRVAARAAAERTGQAAPVPGWVRAAAALALILGTAVGAGVGGSWPLPEKPPETIRTADQGLDPEKPSAVEGSLAESYWTTLEELEP